MNKQFREVSRKFGTLLDQLPPNNYPGPGQLLGVRLEDRWEIAVVDGPGWKSPKDSLKEVLISDGRLGQDRDGAFRVKEGLSRRLWKNLNSTQSLMDDPWRVRPSQIVVATWEYPDPDWYVGEVGRSGGELGFEIDDDMYGPIIMHGQGVASVIIIADVWGPKDWRPERKKRRS